MEFLSDGSLGTIALAILLFALVLTFGFEFVNGFHDTANAVATVIYTHSLTPTQAVLWSGLWNFLGVMASSGAVAFAIVALLPIELILHVRTEAGIAVVLGQHVWCRRPASACRRPTLIARSSASVI